MAKPRFRFLVGIAFSLTFVGSLLIAGQQVASSSPDYKNMVDDVFGIHYESGGKGGADTYAFKSDYKNTTELLDARAELVERLSEEGSVLLKNNGALPLRKNGESKEIKVNLLGSRAFTYSNNERREGLRDSTLSVYGGIVGSKIYQQSVTLSSRKKNLPVTLIDGLKEQDILVNPACEQVYANKPFPSLVNGSEANGSQGGPFAAKEPAVQASDFQNASSYDDASIVFIGRASGEGREYFPGSGGIADPTDGSKSALNLSNDERNLIKEGAKLSDKVIVLIDSAIPMEIEELKSDPEIAPLVDSVLWIGLPGGFGMSGVAKLLSGAASPSGGLPDTYAVDASASPAAMNFGVSALDGSGNFVWSEATTGFYNHADNNHYVVLAEGIYDGYYYYETRYADTILNRGNASAGIGLGRKAKDGTWSYEDEVSYPFGYGLSYTDFSMSLVPFEDGSNIHFDATDESYSVHVEVKNTGNVPGKKAVQLYASSPYTDYDRAHGVEKPAIQLFAFNKTKELAPEETEIIELKGYLKYLASYDMSASHDGVTGGYILEDAEYYFALGNGAHEALNNALLKSDASLSDRLYSEEWSTLNADLAFAYNPASDEAVTSLPRGAFSGGLNANLLNLTSNEAIVSNQIQDADYNFHKPGTVTYLTRSDYQASFPRPYARLDVTDSMKKYLGTSDSNAGRVYDFKTGSTDVEWGVDYSSEEDEDGNPGKNLMLAELKGASYEDERWGVLLPEITFDEAYKFAPYGGASCKPFKSIASPELWQIDGPNGNVTRGLGAKANTSGPMAVASNDPNFNYLSADLPCEPIEAATFNPELLEKEGESYGEDCLWSNNPISWAPGANLHRCPWNSRNHEYYSEDPILTNVAARCVTRGGVKKGMILSAKHFAFNTQESYREGLCQFFNEQYARELELRAFQGLIEDVNYENSQGLEVDGLGLMSSFSRVGVCGVNAHTGLMVNILRKEWGFKGLISTDMVVGGRYFNPQDCVINNVTFMATSNADNLLNNYWPDYNNVSKVKSDPHLNKALRENMHYYLYAVANSFALNGFDASATVASLDEMVSPWQIGMNVGGGITLGVGAALFVLFAFINRKAGKEEE